jgi:hypothetical protein
VGIEEIAAHVAADEGIEVRGRGDYAPGGPGPGGGYELADVFGRAFGDVVAVYVGFLELGAGKEVLIRPSSP